MGSDTERSEEPPQLRPQQAVTPDPVLRPHPSSHLAGLQVDAQVPAGLAAHVQQVPREAPRADADKELELRPQRHRVRFQGERERDIKPRRSID